MPRKAATPTITKHQFDAIAHELRAELESWWEDEAQSFDAAVTETASVWEGMPEIDSKAVVKASPLIERYVGAELDPAMIRRGGYESFDDLADDLLAKIRDACPSHPLVAPRTTHKIRRDSLHVRKS